MKLYRITVIYGRDEDVILKVSDSEDKLRKQMWEDYYNALAIFITEVTKVDGYKVSVS